jgi:hypothetical protein
MIIVFLQCSSLTIMIVSQNIESFYSLTVTILSQKYQELSVQVEISE